jgi:hypothetical protein
MPTIDWTDLARRLGSLEESGGEHAGSGMAREALEEIVDADVFRSAVDHYLSGSPGGELARHVLWLTHPWPAMQRCHQIYSEDPDVEARRRAIELLRVVADRRALPWIAACLADPDPQIQYWGAGIVDQLLFSGLVEEEECESLLRAMADHPHEGVRKQHAYIRQYLAQREGNNEVNRDSPECQR